MNTSNEICKGCTHDGTLQNIDTQCQYCACGEKYEPKPEADRPKQIPAVSGSLPFELLLDWCKKEGWKIDAKIILDSYNRERLLIDCNSKMSVNEFENKIYGNDR